MAALLTRRLPAPTKLDHILACATRAFYEKGYDGASIRDISRRSRVSLAGLYYYVHSKEELLYLIQRHCFSTLKARAETLLASGVPDPAVQLRLFIRNHLEFFLQNPEAMKVLSHEADTLTAPYVGEVAEIKRGYYRICRGLLEELKRQKRLKNLNTRVAVLSLFGMMNWIYTWYKPKVDPDADSLATQMAEIFFQGVLMSASNRAGRNGYRRRGRE
ncbi:MAG: TetR/AcrR family transcriptional regulator [Acidobacteria bacterium]|nr:TetR/AcrR family transcriptional regulator [Acidobacteriota bacterium]